MQISVIIPVHNASKYLKRCLDSVLGQTFRGKYEVILVENGSSDDSWEKIQEYVARDKGKVRAFQSKVLGAAAARNLGVLKATGKYMWFIDADDEIAKTAMERLYEVAECDGADLVMFDAERRILGGGKRILTAVDPADKDWKKRFVRYGLGPWHLLIRRDWWVKNKFLFNEGMIHEDMELMPVLILNTDRLSAVHEILYIYHETSGSVLHQKEWNGSYFDIFPVLDGLYRRFDKKNAVREYYDDLEYFFIWNLLIDSARDFRNFKEGKSGFGRARRMMKKYFPSWRKNKYLREKSLGFRLRVWLGYLGV